MMIFVDLRDAEIAGGRFAFYNTVVDRFVEDCIQGQAWETLGEFKEGYEGSEEIERFIALTPDWAKQDPQ